MFVVGMSYYLFRLTCSIIFRHLVAVMGSTEVLYVRGTQVTGDHQAQVRWRAHNSYQTTDHTGQTDLNSTALETVLLWTIGSKLVCSTHHFYNKPPTKLDISVWKIILLGLRQITPNTCALWQGTITLERTKIAITLSKNQLYE